MALGQRQDENSIIRHCVFLLGGARATGELLGVSPGTVKQWIQWGRLPATELLYDAGVTRKGTNYSDRIVDALVERGHTIYERKDLLDEVRRVANA